MTLLEWLATLPADPTDPTSPTLVVAEGRLSPGDRKRVVSEAYARRPYAVVVGLPRGAPLRLHNRRTRLQGGIDIHLNHPPSVKGDLPDGAALAELQALIARAPDAVDEAAVDYPLAKPLALVTEVDPRPASFDSFDGLTATTRLTYAIWR